ncbi:hypothetical protein [Clostridium sp. YIM B02551]|uniref:hypothetical protein n=1 Tax=Clostridium sp. YIM B02551 TaxID=2910679 RepID=UPI001EEBA4C2|nr:hypothetical protein [Clostridium sp. YIM B02551]
MRREPLSQEENLDIFTEMLKEPSLSRINISKVTIGLVLIILSPALGALLFSVYLGFAGYTISTDMGVSVFMFSCILAVALFGLALVLVGISEKQSQKAELRDILDENRDKTQKSVNHEEIKGKEE